MPDDPDHGAGPPLSRRELLGLVAKGGVAAGGAVALGLSLHDQDGPDRESLGRPQVRDYRVHDGREDLPQLSLARDGSPEDMTRAVVDALGGMARFVSRGDRVTVKPNVGWDRDPRHAANTNPEVVAAVVAMCFEAGASEVVVTDNPCNEPRRVFSRSGIGKATQLAGGTVVLPEPHLFVPTRVGGRVLDEWPVFRPFLTPDKVINVAPVKHHGLSELTCAMKNWYGLLGGRRNLLHQDIDQSIFDLASFLRPTLTVVDAVRVLVRNGPQGGSYSDAEERNQVAATTDLVAGDAWGAELLERAPRDIGYVRLAHGVLGTADWRTLRVKET